MIELLENIGIFIDMILKVLVQPNTGASNTNYSILPYLFQGTNNTSTAYTVRYILLLSFGLLLIGGSIGIVRRFLWKN